MELYFFVRGSQDKALEEVIGEFPRASFLQDSITELIDFDLVLSHYPLAVWNGKDSEYSSYAWSYCIFS